MKNQAFAPLPGADSRANPIYIAVWCLYEGIVKDGYLFKNRDAGLGSDLLKAWVDLYEYGQGHGFIFLTFDQVSDWSSIDAIILCDRPLDGNPLVDRAMQSQATKYLITSECPIIYPGSWDRDYHRRFKRVWTWDDSLVDGSFYLKCNSVTDPTVACDFAQQKATFAERKLVTMIAGAKASQHPNELYSHRVRAIRWFEASAPDHFDLYGMGWNATDFPSYKGAVIDKLTTLAGYRFCICYENAQGYPGYITEKILDCLRTGTIPIYGGAPNIEKWIPSDCFISVTQFDDFFALFQFLHEMDAATYGAYLDRIERFVAGPKYYPFSIPCMLAGFTRTLQWDLRENKRSDVVLLQNPASLCMEQRASESPLIVWIPYDFGSLVHVKLRGLWQFFSSHFPSVKFYFVRCSDALEAGAIVDRGYDLLIGKESNIEQAVHDFLLRRHISYFTLYRTSLFDVFDPDALDLCCKNIALGTNFQGSLGSLMGRDTLVSVRHKQRAIQGEVANETKITDWPSDFIKDHTYSEDPMRVIEEMCRIVRKHRT